MNINTRVGEVEGDNNISGESGVLIPTNKQVLETTESQTKELPHQESEIEPSEQTVVKESPDAAIPILNENMSNMYAKNSLLTSAVIVKFGESLINTYNETMSAILDNWSKQIQQQAEQDKKEAIKRDLVETNLVKTRNKQIVLSNEIKQNMVEVSELTRSFRDVGVGENKRDPQDIVSVWTTASLEEKTAILEDYGERAVANYNQKFNDPALQNMDLAKAITPFVYAFMVQQLDINPLVSSLVTKPIGEKDKSIIDSLMPVLPVGINSIPRVNLMVPLPLLSSLAEANVVLANKSKPKDSKVGVIDEEFINEFAKRTLKKVKNMENFLSFHNPSFLALDPSQKRDVQMSASLAALTTVLIFDVKSQATFSNLSPEEFASILKNGIPQNDLLNQVVQEINLLLNQIADSTRKLGFVNFVLNYIDEAKRSTIENLKNFTKALMYATDEIHRSTRSTLEPN